MNNLIANLPISNDDPLETLKLALHRWGVRAHMRPKFQLKSITLSQTAELLKQLGNSKSSGHDQLDSYSLKIASTNLLQPIQYIINQSLLSGVFPNKWKIAQLIPLHKGKGSCTFNPSNYRPISILPVVSKLAERAVQHQLINFMDQTSQLNRNHHAYRTHHSTITAVIQMTDRIFKATDNNLITTLLTIDESSAFDCVPHDLLLEKMTLYNFSGDTVKWFRSYLHGRSQYVSISGKHSSMSTVLSGVPQGSVLGPLMYTLYINELPDVLKDPENCNNDAHEPHEELFGKNCASCGEIPCFADDTTVIQASNSRNQNQEKLKSNLKTISKFLGDNKLAVNEDKTTVNEIMIAQKCSKITGISPSLTVKDRLGNEKILVSGSYTRILGINISNNLNWVHHLETGENAIIPKIRKQIGALNLLSSSIPRSSRLLLANGLIMSRICYLIQVWGSASTSQLKKVQIVVNRAARFVTGFHKRTSTIKLMNACNWLLMKELCSYQSLISLWTTIHRNIPKQICDKIQIDNDMFITTTPPRLITVAHSYRWRTVGIWNQLDTEIRTQHSLPRFKKALKNWIRDRRNIEPD